MYGDTTHKTIADRLLKGGHRPEVRLAIAALLPWLGQPEILRTLDLEEIATLREHPLPHLRAARQILLDEMNSNSNHERNVTSRDSTENH